MAIDFQQIFDRIREIGAGAKERQETLKGRRDRARNLLKEHAADLDRLREKAERVARDVDPNLRCALPLTERLDARVPPPPPPDAATLIAVDGSQIVPDRHAAVLYGLVNVGAIVMRLNSSAAPQVFTESRLLYGDEVRAADGSLFGEGDIALRRDAAERAHLLTLAKDFPPPVITMTDGPVELWGAKDPRSASSYHRYLREYLDDLERLRDLGVILSGYVDKPGADLVVRLLEVVLTPEGELRQIRAHHPLRGVSDRWLFGNLLRPGERSAVFALQSSSRAHYRDDLAIHFFYLNSGSERRPAVARIEVPRWVAADAEKLDLLHAALVQQSRLLGGYPYLLHRAHEAATVSREEREQVELMLAMELEQRGVEVEGPSHKMIAKIQSEKKRHPR